jgi:hypothetical protein
MQTDGSVSVQLKISCSGDYKRGKPTSYDDYGSPDECEDLEVKDLAIEIYEMKDRARQWVPHDILKGVDIQNREVQRLFDNILSIPEVYNLLMEELGFMSGEDA